MKEMKWRLKISTLGNIHAVYMQIITGSSRTLYIYIGWYEECYTHSVLVYRKNCHNHIIKNLVLLLSMPGLIPRLSSMCM